MDARWYSRLAAARPATLRDGRRRFAHHADRRRNSAARRLAGDVQKYQMPDGRRLRRVEFGTALDSLRRARTELAREVSFANRSPFRVAKLGRPRTVDR
jgi:uncharacterized membrane protein YccC